MQAISSSATGSPRKSPTEQRIPSRSRRIFVNWTDVPFNQMIQHPTAANAWLVDVIRPLSGNPSGFLRIRFNPRI
jgi:hypothetical protein